MYTLGVDVGGTFVDLALVDDAGRIRIEKVPSSGSQAIFDCVLQGLSRLGVEPSGLTRIAFGTTVATNVVLERRGARVGLLCTRGFRDILEHQRWHRRHQYDLHEERPDPLSPRWLRLEIDERTAADGTVLKEVPEEDVLKALGIFQREGVEAIAICFLNGHANGYNERRAAQMLSEHEPGRYVSLSSELAPLIREWERTSTTVINAYTQPVISSYLRGFQRRLREVAPQCLLTVMQSNGGVTAVEDATQKPVRTMLSGPAGGVMGAQALAAHVGKGDVISLDMGGTSCDVAVLKGRTPELTKEAQIEYNMPVMVPMIRINTIGAGGGSVAWVDRGGVMKVGPQSAGANPGPVCYQRGGSEPTVTDAQLILGRLSPRGLLGGRMSLSKVEAERAFVERICTPLGLSLQDAVVGVIKIANVKMGEAIRLLTTNRGVDPRDFALVAFGGAGPMHACELAEMLGIRQVIVPSFPGVMSAVGLATSSRKTDAIISVNRSLENLAADQLNALFADLEKSCQETLQAQGVPLESQVLTRAGDFRYEGQSFEVTVPLERHDYGPESIGEMAEAFHRGHFELYRYSRGDETPFLVSVQVIATERKTAPIVAAQAPAGASGGSDGPQTREVYSLASDSFRTIPVWYRRDLPVGAFVQGPAIIEQFDSTVLVTESFGGRIDPSGNIVLERGSEK